MNLLISDVEEYITIIEDNKKMVENKSFGLLFLRGDLVIILIPQNK
jgi:small nuclear ribonucleoprotein (snRNP)-like protein